MKIIGYHGTSKENGESIKNNGIFQSSKNGWFGTGAYFFKDDKEMAVKWSERRHPNKERLVFEVKITVNEEDTLDMTTSEGEKIFHEQRNKMIAEIKNRKIRLETSNGNFDNIVCNALQKMKKLKVILAKSFTFDNPNRYFNSRIPNGTEICVFDNETIKIQEVYRV